MDQLQQVIAERPKVHRSETEIERPFEPSESLRPSQTAKRVATAPNALTCYGIDSDVLSFIAETIGEGSRTLETGAGLSTLVFAIRRAVHIAVTPSLSEIERIKEYADQRGITLDTVQFVPESSDHYLPRCATEALDLVLLDGKHAFPWPIVDWFFTADKLRRGGVMVIDDAQMRSVEVLAEFMRVDPGWQLIHDFSSKTLAFRKNRDSIHDVAWHMQPWTIAPSTESASGTNFLRRLGRRLKRLMARQG